MKRKTNKAFTLIELLAVIVILAIIALIATPIILGIVEDTRKDAFLRSVELVVSTTDMDITSKTYEEEYTYTIEDGNISNLEIGVKNTQGLNGSITYDNQGNDMYAVHNGVYCVIKKSNMKRAEVSDYVEGECSYSLTFKEFLDLNSSEGYRTPSGQGQLINLGEYGIRYQGSDPDNYIYFNCSDYNNQTSETCEIWRIIGVVDGKVKIKKDVRLEIMAYGETNDWKTASLQLYLNGEYYEGLTSNTKSLISPSTWYLGQISNDSSPTSKEMLYNMEREVDDTNVFNANIGLIYCSDYIYAFLEEGEDCFSPFDNPETMLICSRNNWMSYSAGNGLWTITPSSKNGVVYAAIAATALGVHPGTVYATNNNQFSPAPVIYLTSDIEFKDGKGSILEPYQISVR